ncbi:UNVERIFIED_CONTAM: hypothetical protein HDU68_012799 [Siphonaria sp. JEL0065]|nr:hypothetical protein HDU68_012799 [Siphonaria sp. JEL0065]
MSNFFLFDKNLNKPLPTPQSPQKQLRKKPLPTPPITTAVTNTINSPLSILFISDGDRSDSATLTLQLIEQVSALAPSWAIQHTEWHSETDFDDARLSTVDRVVYVAKTEMRIREKLVGKVAEQYRS